MAQKVILIDDLDPNLTATVHREFTIGDDHYEIDLADKNAAAFDKDLKKWIDAARKVKAPTGRGRSRPAAGGNRGRPSIDREQSSAIREWALKNGHKVSDRGRIAADVVEEFEKAHAPAGEKMFSG